MAEEISTDRPGMDHLDLAAFGTQPLKTIVDSSILALSSGCDGSDSFLFSSVLAPIADFSIVITSPMYGCCLTICTGGWHIWQGAH